MMLISRYLFRHIAFVTVFAVLTLTAVIWLTQSLQLLELVANSDAPGGMFLKLVFLSLPQFLEILLPLSLVMAILFVYNKMIADNELIVMRACGVDQWALAKPAFTLAMIITVVLFFLTSTLSPNSRHALTELRDTVKAKYSAFLLRAGVFNTFNDDLTVYLHRRDTQGDLYGLMIHDARDKDKPPVTVTAKRGRIVAKNGVPTIDVFDGIRQQMDDNGAISKLYFSQYTLEIKNLATADVARWQRAKERTLSELVWPEADDTKAALRRDAFLAEIHYRLVTPLNAIGFTAIALAIILLGSFNRRGQKKKILLAGVIVAVLQALNMLIVNEMRSNIAYTVVLYILTFVPAAAGFFFLSFKGETFLTVTMRRRRMKEAR